MEFIYFKMEAMNIFLSRHYDINDKETVPTIGKWLGREELKLIKTLTVAEQETYQTVRELFDMPGKNLSHSMIKGYCHYSTVNS